jgi:hypothetical protein
VNELENIRSLLAMGITGVVGVFMAIIRDILRTTYLSPYFKAGELATKTSDKIICEFLFFCISA